MCACVCAGIRVPPQVHGATHHRVFDDPSARSKIVIFVHRVFRLSVCKVALNTNTTIP